MTILRSVSALFLALISLNSYSQLTSESTLIGNTTRDYLLYKPVNFQASENMPVVFVLHGLGSNNQVMSQALFSEVADTGRFLVIYPQGLNNMFGQSAWNNSTGAASNVDDIGFFVDLIEDMVANQGADRNRMYFTGFSMGSIMSHHLACAMNDKVAAIAGMAGTMPDSDIANCVPTYKTPVIHLHGTADGTVPYDSNPLPGLSLVPETMAFWQNVHGCTTETDSTRIADTASDNITVDQFEYTNCDEEDILELWRFNGADHIYLFEPANDITEAKEIWLFLQKWTHPNASSSAEVIEQNKISSGFSVAIPNPSNGKFQFHSEENGTFNVYDASGKLVDHVAVQKGNNKIELHLEKGIYLLKMENAHVKLQID